VIAYKFLRPDGTSVFTRYTWPLPDDGPGPWVDAEVDPCRSGIHACRRADLPLWLGRSLYEIELEGEVREEATKVVAESARLLLLIDAWDELTRDEYTRMCADRAHELARAADLAGWDAVVEPSVPEGPALLGFVAARIAEKISGADAYHAERRHQADWLADRLGL
jgi:alkylation response protein AidB-like acyl-CoA dehydrogenase